MIKKLEDMTEEQRDRIIMQIMHYQPSPKVRDRILKEVIDFKWLDCENIGLDIYASLVDEQQLVVAGFEWRTKHWKDFFETNDTEGVDQPRDFSLIHKNSG